ncbi:hypothetical protein V6N11_050263 [Hibiscus sabdariffa]|uniref:Uncharacterized protein n=1 Tax=Hibiscus sabdariffa TaxID=183260 RepID=A0ABR2T9Y9_9ROSI
MARGRAALQLWGTEGQRCKGAESRGTNGQFAHVFPKREAPTTVADINATALRRSGRRSSMSEKPPSLSPILQRWLKSLRLVFGTSQPSSGNPRVLGVEGNEEDYIRLRTPFASVHSDPCHFCCFARGSYERGWGARFGSRWPSDLLAKAAWTTEIRSQMDGLDLIWGVTRGANCRRVEVEVVVRVLKQRAWGNWKVLPALIWDRQIWADPTAQIWLRKKSRASGFLFFGP